MANLLLTILDAVGVHVETIGDRTGCLPLEPLSLAWAARHRGARPSPCCT